MKKLELQWWVIDMVTSVPEWGRDELAEIIHTWDNAIHRGVCTAAEASLIASNEIFDKFSPVLYDLQSKRRQLATHHTRNFDKNNTTHRREFIDTTLNNELYVRAWEQYRNDCYNGSQPDVALILKETKNLTNSNTCATMTSKKDTKWQK